MSDVERLLHAGEEVDETEVMEGEGRMAAATAAAASSSRPASARQQQPQPRSSRRGSLQQLVRPAVHEEGEGAPADGEMDERLLAQHGSEDPDGSPQASARSRLGASPLPGVVDEEAEGASPAATASLLSNQQAATSSSSSKRRQQRGETPRYTTTLEEDAARDVAEQQAREDAERRRIEQEDLAIEAEQQARARQQQEEEEAAAAAAASGGDDRPASSSRHDRQPSNHEDDSTPEPRHASASHKSSHSAEAALLPNQMASEEGEQQDQHPPAADLGSPPEDGDMIQPAPRVRVGSAASGSSSDRQRRRIIPAPSNDVDPIASPSAAVPADASDDEAAASPTGMLASPTGDHRFEHEDQPLGSPSGLADEDPAADPAGAASPLVSVDLNAPAVVPEQDEPSTPVPVFEHVVRQYPTIDDPLLELKRIRAYKDFEAEFDDLVLPTFSSLGLREQEHVTAPAALHLNPLKSAYDEVHALRDSASAEPLVTVEDSALLVDVLGVSAVSLEDATRLEADLEADRIHAMQAELARKQRQDYELASFTHALNLAHATAAEQHKAELAEKEHQLLQKTRLLMKEEQESFRRAEDRMREWLRVQKGASLSTHMQDLQGAPPQQHQQSQADRDRAARESKEKEDRRSTAMGILGSAGEGANNNIDELASDALKAEIVDLYAKVRSRRYDIAWDYAPRLVRLRLDWLRCLKNKLPLGNYQFMVTLYDRLGGTPLRWSGNPQGLPSNVFSHTGATLLPQKHSGRFYNLDLVFNQRANRIFLACPPLVLSRPSMVFVFELFLCGDKTATAATQTQTKAGSSGQPQAQQSKVSSIFASMYSGAASMASSASVLASELLLKARDPKQYAILKTAQAKAAALALQRAPPSSDKVVAWGAFPMSYINFDIIRGAFKVPLLRGKYRGEGSVDDGSTAIVEKFSTIHDKIANNLDEWLANLYFDVKPWTRLVDNAVENGVGLNFKGRSKNAAEGGGAEPDSDEEEEEEEAEMANIIGEDGALAIGADGAPRKLAASGSAAAAAAAAAAADVLSLASLDADILVLDGAVSDEPALLGAERSLNRDSGASAPYNSQRAHVRRNTGTGAGEEHAIDFVSSGGGGGLGSGAAGADGNNSAAGSATNSKRAKVGKSDKKKESSEAVTSTERRIQIKLLSRRFPGMLRDIPDLDESSAAAADLRSAKKRADLCDKYKYHLNLASGGGDDDEGAQSHTNNPLGRRAAYKLRYIANELWADLGFSHGRDWQFLFMLLFASLWVRIFSHYLGQYLFLSSIGVPITRWSCELYTCHIEYVWDPLSVTAQTQVGVVVIGEITNLCAFLVLIGVVVAFQRVLGRTPSWMSRLLLAWGVGTCVEVFLILLIDCARQQWFGDSFKLYQYYLAKDGNGVSGIFMTILLSLLLLVISIVCFYYYVIFVHMNGRILDVHRRLHGGPAQWQLPHDLEISVRELRWILLKARRWVGMGGQKRKVHVSKFVVRDPLRRVATSFGKDATPSSDTSIYIAIYTQSLTGDVELFRHFVRSPCGRVCEVFDAIESPGEDQFKKIEEKLTQHERRIQALQSLADGMAAAGGAAGGAGPASGSLGLSAGGGKSELNGLVKPRPLGLGLGGLSALGGKGAVGLRGSGGPLQAPGTPILGARGPAVGSTGGAPMGRFKSTAMQSTGLSRSGLSKIAELNAQ